MALHLPIPLLSYRRMADETKTDEVGAGDPQSSTEPADALALEASSSESVEEQLGDEPSEVTADDAWPQGSPELSYAAAAPNINVMKPLRVDSRGGTPVTIFGAGFVPGCRVLVAEEECITELVDAFTLRFTTPAGTGSASVVVEAPSGKRSPEPGLLYYAEGPRLHRAIPAEGPTEGGIEVVLEGENFSSGIVVSLFGEHAPDCVFETPGRITFVLPPVGAALEGALVVTTLDGLMDRSDTVFRYKPLVPRIDEVDPPHAWINGGKLVALRGKDFHKNVRAFVDGVEATVNYRDATHVDVEVPPRGAPGTVDISVENPDRRRAVLQAGFRYEPLPAPPKLLALLPDSGPTTGGKTIRVSGDNFREDIIVRVGELTVRRTVVSEKLLDFELPARQTPGKVAVEFVLAGVSVRTEEAFTYISPQVPKISSLEPRSGPTTGGTRVVFEGDDFPTGASVRFGTEMAKVVSVKSPTRMEVVTPAVRAAGVVDVVVSSADRGDGVAVKGFKFEAVPAPVITLVSPAKGTTEGNTELSIEGKNFVDGAIVLVGGHQAKKVKRISGSVLEAFTPGGQDGALVDVVVKNPDGQQAVMKRAFQFDARYRS